MDKLTLKEENPELEEKHKAFLQKALKKEEAKAEREKKRIEVYEYYLLYSILLWL